MAARRPVPGSPYGATKAAVSSLADAVRAEVAHIVLRPAGQPV
ncbi:hypothetical protein [Luteipulveratus flavus]|uniref:Short chain dehydrogenase n=1 Tax=Luteipulveratus flavus TaxID=3031728 RepID=A0ABT6C914_9MICO|nr:hypothetical protein [Luteipulveratus sp. YIM 133296]MDF8265409.1 hypothetical protein [Luteipulveratus sp. YIM 133296]